MIDATITDTGDNTPPNKMALRLVPNSPFMTDPDFGAFLREVEKVQFERANEIRQHLLALFELICNLRTHTHRHLAYWNKRFPAFSADAPILALAGIGDSGHADIAEEHDRFLR